MNIQHIRRETGWFFWTTVYRVKKKKVDYVTRIQYSGRKKLLVNDIVATEDKSV